MRAALLCLVVLAACASPVRMYDGEPRDASEIARLRPNRVMIHSVDGKELERDASIEKRTIELLPGEHTIRIQWSGGSFAATPRPAGPRGRGAYYAPRRVGVGELSRRPYAEFVIDVQAGHTYEGIWVPREDGSTLHQPVFVEKKD